jgi:hypothetical protein
MPRRLGRILVAFATAFAAWIVATPARAAAPVCDPHAATGVAPAPVLQLPETYLDVAPADGCAELLGVLPALGTGRAPAPAPPTVSQEPLVPNVIPAPTAADLVGRLGADEPEIAALAGARARVERPPR